jgi:hypothetical protein
LVGDGLHMGSYSWGEAEFPSPRASVGAGGTRAP